MRVVAELIRGERIAEIVDDFCGDGADIGEAVTLSGRVFELVDTPLGEEALYELKANVIQMFVSFWY